jgi:hypothetical protein
LQQANGPATTAQGFALSRENRMMFVQNVFLNLLHRPATSGEVSYFLNQPGDGLAVEQLILGTPEFFGNG